MTLLVISVRFDRHLDDADKFTVIVDGNDYGEARRWRTPRGKTYWSWLFDVAAGERDYSSRRDLEMSVRKHFAVRNW